MNNAAACFHRQGHRQEAMMLLRHAVEKYPQEVVLWRNGGHVAESLGQWEDAVTFFEVAMHLEQLRSRP
jgi:hypothetical protein